MGLLKRIMSLFGVVVCAVGTHTLFDLAYKILRTQISELTAFDVLKGISMCIAIPFGIVIAIGFMWLALTGGD